MNQQVKKYICVCGREFDNPQAFNGHKSHCKDHQINKYGSLESLYISEEIRHSNCQETVKAKNTIISQHKQEKQQLQLQQWISEEHTCENCGKVMTEKYGSGRFCSKSCANTRKHSKETKEKLRSVSIKNKSYKNFFDSDGNHKATRKNRSKSEIKLFELIKNLMPNSMWTFGKIGNYNNTTLSPDMYSRVLKCVIEYDGIWHFEDICGQLAYKQNYDKLMLEYCKQIGYKLIRIDEQYEYKIEELLDLILNSTEQVILLGSRYQYLNN